MPFADLAERRVFYVEEGDGAPLLLLGDLGADHTMWADQLERFKPELRVIAFDNPGSGMTSGPRGPYSTELFADVTAELLGRVTSEPVHVLGAFMGGAIAQQLALRHPTLVRSLVLHGTYGRSDNHLRAVLRSWQTAARALPRIDLCRQMWLSEFTVWQYNDRVEALAELERQALEVWAPQSPDDFCDQAEACISHDVLDRLGEIAAPTLIIVGDRDVLTPPHQAYAIKERMPEARVRVWQQMGHAPFWEKPDDFNTLCRDFFAEH